jgi:peptidyl-prolyl cis-trans isomerase C
VDRPFPFEVFVRKSTVAFAFLLALGCQKAPAQPAGSQPASPPAGQPGAAAAPAPASQQPDAPKAPPAPAAKPVPAQLPDVVARVNGDAITKAEFEEALHSIEQRAGRQVPAEQRDTVYRGMLDQLINLRILKQELKTRNVSVEEAEVDARIAEIRQQFKSEDEFKQALAARSTTVEALRPTRARRWPSRRWSRPR